MRSLLAPGSVIKASYKRLLEVVTGYSQDNNRHWNCTVSVVDDMHGLTVFENLKLNQENLLVLARDCISYILLGLGQRKLVYS